MSRVWSAAGVIIALVATGCASTPSDNPREVVVSAAASLSDAFSDIEMAFESIHPDFDVLLNLAGSAALREQILEGAPVDVFASANPEVMADVVRAGGVDGSPHVFAANTMVIAVPTGNPGAVMGLDDFEREDLFVGLCAQSVPCGSLAREVLRSATVEPIIDTNEPDVRSLLLKIGLGEIDVGMVYTTDALAATATVDAIAVPPQNAASTLYPIALLAAATSADGGDAFIRFVTSDPGVEILERHGFVIP